MAEPLDVDEMRQTLARVSAYRNVCEKIRASAGHTALDAFWFLGIAGFYYFQFRGFHPILIGWLALGFAELLVAGWKYFRPTPEAFLADGALQVLFVLSMAFRVWLWVQLGMPPARYTVFALLALWVAYGAFNTFNTYFVLRKVFPTRPSAEHIAYVEDLIDEVAHGDPQTDPTSIDVQTKRRRFKAKLLGDVAIVYNFRSRDVFLVTRDEVEIVRQIRGDEPETVLTIQGQAFPPFAIDPDSWKNYATWKTAGGMPPPPPTILPTSHE